MKKPSKKSVLLASAALVASIAVPAVAYADTPSPPASASLANELGIDDQQLSAALAKLREKLRSEYAVLGYQGYWAYWGSPSSQADLIARWKERLVRAVQEGTLTQAEADAITNAYEAGIWDDWDGTWNGTWDGDWDGNWNGWRSWR